MIHIKNNLSKSFNKYFNKGINKSFNTNRNLSITTGGELIYYKLLQNNVNDVFLFSGGSVMSIVDPFYKGRINYYVNSHEQNCGHAATGYAKSSKKPGVVLVTSGPGITNMITSMLDATNDSTPLIVISGQVPKHAVGTNAFQEAPAVELSQHVTKWSYQIQHPEEISDVIDKAFHIATSGKPGSVHIDVPKCVSSQNIEDLDCLKYKKQIIKSNIIKYDSETQSQYINKNNIKEIVKVIEKSQKPIIYLGQGCKSAALYLRSFAIANNIPVTSTIHAKGIFDDHNDLSLEWCGMHGLAAANYALQEADCIIALGSRFDDRTTGAIDKYAPIARKNKAIIHVNIEESEFNKALKTHYNVHSTCHDFIKSLSSYMFKSFQTQNKIDKHKEWINRVKRLKEKYPFDLKKSNPCLKNDAFHMEEVIDELYKQTLSRNVIFTTGVGNHQMQAYQFIKCQYPNKILSSGSLGVMGAGLPYSVGAQIANRDKLIINIDGDSSFNMTMSDMKTIVEHKLPIKIAIMNNDSQMMVTIWEKLYFNERYTATINERNPDYVKLAESFGIKAMKCTPQNGDNLSLKVEEFINYDGPILCEFKIKKDICLPLVGPGKALDDMILPGDVTMETIKIEGGEIPG